MNVDRLPTVVDDTFVVASIGAMSRVNVAPHDSVCPTVWWQRSHISGQVVSVVSRKSTSFMIKNDDGKKAGERMTRGLYYTYGIII